MIPPLIVDEALRKGIQIIAITDHNATANVKAVQKAAEGSGLVVLGGMELQTKEEVHLLCLFEENETLEAWQKIVDQALPNQENNPDFFV
jgi:predicted metal-dependent phosphoesterase TrpH